MDSHLRIRRVILALIAIALSAVAPTPQPTHASGPWYVASDGSDGNSCLSPAAPCATINGAIGKAVSGDTIYIAEGTYTGSGTEAVLINKDITLSGGWDAAFAGQTSMSTIDGQGARRGITAIGNVAASIERFQVQNGFANGGGGIHSAGNSLAISYSIIKSNVSNDLPGGGIYNYQGTLTLINSSVSQNQSVRYMFAYGGGIGNVDGVLNVTNSTIANNVAYTTGGGLYVESDSTVTLSSSTVSGNQAAEDPSGIYGGGGIYTYSSPFFIRNSIVAGNTTYGVGPDCIGVITSLGYNLVGDTSDCTVTAGTGDLLNVEAGLLLLLDWLGYYPLGASSLAIDGGNPNGCIDSFGVVLTTDQRGAARVGRCDIGAYEYTTPGPPANIIAIGGTPQITNVGTAFPLPFGALALDEIGSPASNAAIIFSAPDAEVSGLFIDTGTYTTTATAGEDGIATAPTFVANSLAGSYEVTATANGVDAAGSFSLTNVGALFLPLALRNFCADFFDDFSDPASGWPVEDDDLVTYEYLNGEYRILSKVDGYLFLSRSPGCDRENYTVQADIRWDGEIGSSYGLLLGLATDYGYFYLFDINTDYEQFRLLRLDANGWATVVPVTDAPAINSGTASNHLKATRNGTAITLEVNGTVLGTWYDSAISGLTGTGVVAAPYLDVPTSDARFDNFSVTGLPGGGAQPRARGQASSLRQSPTQRIPAITATVPSWRRPER